MYSKREEVVRWVETSISSKNPTSTAIKKRRNQFKPLSFSSVLPRSGWNPAGSKGPESLRQARGCRSRVMPAELISLRFWNVRLYATIWFWDVHFLIQIETIVRLRIVLLSAFKIHELPARSIPFQGSEQQAARCINTPTKSRQRRAVVVRINPRNRKRNLAGWQFQGWQFQDTKLWR